VAQAVLVQDSGRWISRLRRAFASMPLPTAVFFFAACAMATVWAEVRHFNGEVVPKSGSLEGLYIFYVHSYEDSPGPKAAQSRLTFKDIRLRGEDGGPTKSAWVAVGVLPWSEFDNLMDGKTLCGESDGKVALQFKQHSSKQNAHWHRVTFPAEEDASYVLKQSGPYLLVVANCAPEASASKLLMYGSVVVKNPYGYSAGNELFKSWVYGWAALGYVAALLGWVAKLFLFTPKDVAKRDYHSAATFILIMGVLECASYAAFYIEANKMEVSREDSLLLVLAQVSGIAKVVYFIAFFRALAPQSTSRIQQAIHIAVLLLYTTAATIKVTLQASRQSMSIDASAWIFSIIFVAFAGVVALVFVMRGLARMMQRCREASDDKRLAQFQHTTLLTLVLAVSSLVLLGAQYLDAPAQGFKTWYYHTLVADAVPQAMALGALVVMMYMWRPSEDFPSMSEMTEVDAEVIGLKEDTEAPTGRAEHEPAGPVQFGLGDEDDPAAGNSAVAKTIGSNGRAAE